jgi:chromosome segregation ATPase
MPTNKTYSAVTKQPNDRLMRLPDIAEKKEDDPSDYPSMIRLLQDQLAETKAQAFSQDQDHKDQVDDLRLLNNTQQEEIRRLKAQLEGKKTSDDDPQAKIFRLEQALEEANKDRDTLQEAHDEALARVQSEQELLQRELVALKAADLCIERSLDDQEDLLGKVQQLELNCDLLQRELDEAHDKLQRNATQNMEVQLLKENCHDAPAETDGEEDLKKKLEAATILQEQTKATLSEKQLELKTLQEKLADRDTTIATYIYSSMALEQQLSAGKQEIETLRIKLENEGGEGYDIIMLGGSSDHETQQLKTSLVSYREENSRLNKQLQILEADMEVLHEQLHVKEKVASNIGTEASVPSNTQVQERDETFASLVKQLTEQDKTIATLEEQLDIVSKGFEALRNERAVENVGDMSHVGPSWEEVKELRRETEMFAEQVIEQEEEIESLTKRLQSREEQVVELEQQIADLTAKITTSTASTNTIADLSSQVDELEDANQLLQEEMRELKRKHYEIEEAGMEAMRLELVELKQKSEMFEHQVEALSKEKAKLEAVLAEERAKHLMIDDLEEKLRIAESQLEQKEAELRQKDVQIDELTAQAASVDEMEVESLRAEIAELKAKIMDQTTEIDNARTMIEQMEGELASNDSSLVATLHDEINSLKVHVARQTDALDTAKTTILELEREVAEKDSSAATSFNEEKEEIMDEVESLSRKLEEAHAEVKTLSEMVDNYEIKLKLIANDKDTTIDNLNRVLVSQKEDQSGEIEYLKRQLEVSEAEMKQLNEEVTNEISERDERIFELQQSLSAHIDLVGQMKTEMDHLQGSMESSAVGRRKEFDDMQQELSDLTSTVTQQERQIKTLQGKLEDRQIAHQSDLDKLKKEIENLENINEQLGAKHRTALDLQMESRLNEVKDRLEKLRWRNIILQEENSRLRAQFSIGSSLGNSTDESNETRQRQLTGQTFEIVGLNNELIDLNKRSPVKLEPSPSLAPPSPEPASCLPRIPSSPISESSVQQVGLSTRRQRGLAFLSRGRRKEKPQQ